MLSTDGDWLRGLAAHLRRADQMRRSAMAAGGPGRAAAAAHKVPGDPGRAPVAAEADAPRGRLRQPIAEAERMSFREPTVLLGLALLPVAILAYLAVQQRRRREAATFGNPALLPGLMTARPGWRRHIPAALLLLAVAR